MIQEIIKNIFDSFLIKKYQPPVEDKPSNSTDVPDNSTVVDNSTSNGVTQWVNNNKIQLIPILIQHTKKYKCY